MIVYAESSALLAWLFEEPSRPSIEDALVTSEAVVTSALTLIECDRVLCRADAAGIATQEVRAGWRALLADVARTWQIAPFSDAQSSRARRVFPREPVRTLDALHLASALLFRAEIPDLVVLSLDERVRGNAGMLGFQVLPLE